MDKILIIDDDPVILEIISEILKRSGYTVSVATSGASGIKKIDRDYFDLVLTDLQMPEVGGMEVLEFAVSRSPEMMCIILTGYGTIQSSVEAIKKGAFDYVTKPVTADELLTVVEKALKFRRLEEENTQLKRELRQRYRYNNIVGSSAAINKIYDTIEKVADTDGTVLISGASGTGKELIARAVHYSGSRGEKPFVVINCGAIPQELLESELFGHEKGAFTGAYKKRIGRFEMADGGTIFLDEIGEMSPALQVKLLRVLQEQQFERVGGVHTIQVDVRIIAATNRNLTAAIQKGKFREDLYYRLNVIPIKVPALKQRKSDIPLLIDHFLKKFQKGKKGTFHGFSPAAMESLVQYHWPGNVRELENVIQRLTVLCDNEVVRFEDLPDYIQQRSRSIPPPEEKLLDASRTLDEAVDDFEKRLILEALDKSDWVKSRAAELLSIKRTTLVEKIKKKKLTNKITLLGRPSLRS